MNIVLCVTSRQGCQRGVSLSDGALGGFVIDAPLDTSVQAGVDEHGLGDHPGVLRVSEAVRAISFLTLITSHMEHLL